MWVKLMSHKTGSKDVKKLLAEIVDRCDNSLCNLPSTHPKHRAMFDLFKSLASITTSIAGESEVLWWKEYTDNRVNYDKVFYNIKVIKEKMALLPRDIREQIENNISSRYKSDVILKDYEEKELMKELIKEEGKEMGDEEIFWEYELKKVDDTLYLHLYPREEWGISITGKIYYKINECEIVIGELTINRELEGKIKSFKRVSIYGGEVVLEFKDNPNIHEDVKNAMLKLNEILHEGREKAEKIEKELKGIATPKKE